MQNKDHRGQGSLLRANIKVPSNCKGMKASQQFEKVIKAVCQHGKGIKAFFSGGEIKHKNVTCALTLEGKTVILS